MTQFDLFGHNANAVEPKQPAETSIKPVPTPLPPPKSTPPVLPPPYAKKSVTSMAAAESVRANASTLRDKVYAAILRSGTNGMTDGELEVALRLRLQTVVPRRGELVKLGRVYDSGRTRLTQTRRQATVWVARKPQPTTTQIGVSGSDARKLLEDPQMQEILKATREIFEK